MRNKACAYKNKSSVSLARPIMSVAPPVLALRELSTLFTRPLFAAMAGPYGEDEARRKLAGLTALMKGPTVALRELFEQAFTLLEAHYRNEYVFKSALANVTIPEAIGPGLASVQVELPVSTSILDVATAANTTTAFEIKTEFDSARRLESQTENYLKAFDEVYLVTTETMLPSLSRGLDPRVGLSVLQPDGSFFRARDAVSNRANLKSRQVCWGLRQQERIAALERRTGIPLAMPNGILGRYCEEQFASIPALELHEIFLDAMRKRSDAVLKDGFIHTLPRSLRALGYATPLSGLARRRLMATLDIKVALTLGCD